ncbi:TetR/AcrR family transcriptional regulator [Phaeovulum sp.]|uniref:TetR/AcrR family transcriptional regulator n=1 Tax=Phaeovulum sp. TaxID=2934796 RepID=UPI002ABA1C21|nr:TetR/AcrR family transcriptional regulator [Phaeovulum sp.]MDZ4120210.1 TetR/AcrR family transcriptional regulator [Phaeovulum sp.]
MNERKPSGDRKAEILTATLGLAFEVGPDHVTTGMIAGRLGLTQPAIYKHFPSKQDIWRAVSEMLCARIVTSAELARQEGRTPMDRLRRLVINHVQLIAETPALPEIMVTRDPTGSLTDARRRVQAAMGEFRRAATRELEDARAAGNLRDGLRTDDGITLLFGVIQGLVLRLIVTRDPAPLVVEGARLLDLQLSLFVGRGDAA